jgi:hypothetical protein
MFWSVLFFLFIGNTTLKRADEVNPIKLINETVLFGETKW